MYEASQQLRPFLRASDDKHVWPIERKSRAQELREEADRIEAYDAAVKRFRTALIALDSGE